VSVVALIPAHNEAQRIGATVAAARSVPSIDRVLVVDDDSSDETVALARDAGAEVLALESNLGKGGALQAGLDAVGQDADVLVLLDGDLGSTASEAGLLIEPVLAGVADMTIATLPRPPRSGGFGLVKGLARFGIRSRGTRADDTGELLHVLHDLRHGFSKRSATMRPSARRLRNIIP
jgi:glycosyltransferase involved in cell wall biosynthesis